MRSCSFLNNIFFMSKHIFILLSFIYSTSFSQANLAEIETKKKIFFFGEAHFVKEKYDEMKTFSFQKIKGMKKGEKISFFFELPYSINYAFNKIKHENDTTYFNDWFNHLYQSKKSKASFFWKDYRDFILELIKYTDKKGVELQLMGIDTELEFRRTIFILSSFKNKIGKTIDSLLNLNFIHNDSTTREILLSYVKKLSIISDNKFELDVLRTLKKSLKIDCTICFDRDHFIYSNFINNYDSTHTETFATFGLNHVVTKHDFTNASPFFKKKYKFDLEGYKSVYELFNPELKEQICRIGIIAFKQDMNYSDMKMRKDYSNIMSEKERKYLENQLENESVIRIVTKKQNELSNLSSQLDYIIVYKSSNFR